MEPSSPLLETVEVELVDGGIAAIRPILPSDAPLLVEGLTELSESSRFARFGVGVDHLSKQELAYLTQIDQRHHVAAGALVDGVPAGVGRYVIMPDSDCAELALAVVDRFQTNGLGRQLFDALVAVAQHDGVSDLCFEVAPSNDHVQRILHHLDEKLATGFSDGRVAVSELPRSEHHDEIVALFELHRTLRKV